MEKEIKSLASVCMRVELDESAGVQAGDQHCSLSEHLS